MRLLIILCTGPHRTPPSRVGDGKFWFCRNVGFCGASSGDLIKISALIHCELRLVDTMLNTSHRLNNFIQTGDMWNPVIRMMLCIMVSAYILQFDILILSESMSPKKILLAHLIPCPQWQCLVLAGGLCVTT